MLRRFRLELVLPLIVLLAAGGWAAFQVLAGPDPDTVADERYVSTKASYGVVEQSLSLNTAASWGVSSTVSNLLPGTVTEVMHTPGEEIAPGQVLYTVDLQPVIAAEGAIPAFRSLRRGDAGEDVAQLQRLLADTGHYEFEADGRFDFRVHWAVRAWQGELGMEETGTVSAGTVLFIPELPSRASLAEGINVGTGVDATTPAIDLLPESPEFTIELTEGHARILQAGMAVAITHADGSWEAQIEQIHGNDESTFTALLTAGGGESICGEDCGQIPLGEPTLLRSMIAVVPPVEGVTVPASAIITTADGQTAVVLDTGDIVGIDVIAGARGIVVVEGIDVGQSVRVPGENAL